MKTVISLICKFLSFNFNSFRATEPPDLVELQDGEWNSLIEWFQHR